MTHQPWMTVYNEKFGYSDNYCLDNAQIDFITTQIAAAEERGRNEDSLTKLLYECGEGFASLSLTAVDGPEWCASGSREGTGLLLYGEARTPKEAVRALLRKLSARSNRPPV